MTAKTTTAVFFFLIHLSICVWLILWKCHELRVSNWIAAFFHFFFFFFLFFVFAALLPASFWFLFFDRFQPYIHRYHFSMLLTDSGFSRCHFLHGLLFIYHCEFLTHKNESLRRYLVKMESINWINWHLNCPLFGFRTPTLFGNCIESIIESSRNSDFPAN